MNASTLILLLLVLACPISMVWMMRHGHGHGHTGHDDRGHARHDGRADTPEENIHERLQRWHSTQGLHELRDEIDRMIDEREQTEREVATGSRR